MSMWFNLVSKLKELIKNMIGSRTIQNELHVSSAISPKMERAIQTWTNLYLNKADWLHEPNNEDATRVVSLGLPSMIASEKARTALLEFESEITAPVKEVEEPNPNYPSDTRYATGMDGERIQLPVTQQPETIKVQRPIGDTSRADYLESQYKKLKKQLRKQIEYGIAKGGLVIKPYVVVNGNISSDGVNSDIAPTVNIEFDFIQADAFYPLAFDATGKITEAAFIQSKVDKNQVYRRLEYHKWENNIVTVINKAYKSNNILGNDNIIDDLGEEIPLTDVPEWKNFNEKAIIKNVTQPLFAYFKMPEANTVDPTSPLGVSGFSRAVSLIKDADMQYSRLLWEYEAGEIAIDIDRDALREIDTPDGGTKTIPNHLQNRLYRKLDLGSEADTYYPFAPSLRDSSYISGLDTILMKIEDVCGMSRGALSSNMVDVARTATELKILKQRSYQTNADIQSAIEDALRDAIYIMNVYCTLYEITPEGDYEVSFEWDDSIIVDIDAEIEKRILLIQNGIASKLETRMWYFGETEPQAREALSKIQEEVQQAQETDILQQYELNNWRNRNAE